jgi:hypothetical protein
MGGGLRGTSTRVAGRVAAVSLSHFDGLDWRSVPIASVVLWHARCNFESAL